jgi:hypothetical protein
MAKVDTLVAALTAGSGDFDRHLSDNPFADSSNPPWRYPL